MKYKKLDRLPLLELYDSKANGRELDTTTFDDLHDHADTFSGSYLIFPEELPDILFKANVFNFAYGAISGEFSEDRSPYAGKARYIRKFNDYLELIECKELSRIVQKNMTELSYFSEEELASYDRFELKDENVSNKIHDLLWDRKIGEYIDADRYKKGAGLRVKAANYYIENREIEFVKSKVELDEKLKRLVDDVPDYFDRLIYKSSREIGGNIIGPFKELLLEIEERYLSYEHVEIRSSGGDRLAHEMKHLDIYILITTSGRRLAVLYRDAFEIRDYETNSPIAIVKKPERLFQKGLKRLWTYKEAKGWRYDEQSKTIKRPFINRFITS